MNKVILTFHLSSKTFGLGNQTFALSTKVLMIRPYYGQNILILTKNILGLQYTAKDFMAGIWAGRLTIGTGTGA